MENILLTPPSTYKLCDFGSTTVALPASKVPTLAASLQLLEQEINKTTTLQYRAPELVDVWSRKGYDEKIDIWALGVFLYKLCYYTTPFEEHGPLAIMNASYKVSFFPFPPTLIMELTLDRVEQIPPYPAYSNSIKSLIATMLQERASSRPNIYQVHEMVCKLRGSSIKLENVRPSLSPPAPSKVLIPWSRNTPHQHLLHPLPDHHLHPNLNNQSIQTSFPHLHHNFIRIHNSNNLKFLQ